MPRQGKMPGALSGITRVMAPVFIAPCGHRFVTQASAEQHEKAATCWKLPVLKTCKSCKHAGKYAGERECRHPEAEEDDTLRVRPEIPDLYANCPWWEHAGQVVPR